jgi:two-component system, sensor histidine kinase RetS
MKPSYLLTQLTIIFLIFFTGPLQANPTIEIFSADDKTNLGPHIQWIEDSSSELTFEHVSTLPDEMFNHSNSYTFNQGYTSSSYWLKIQIKFSPELINRHWLLEIPFPLLDYIALYKPDSANTYTVIHSGDRSPFSQRDFNTTDFVFNLQPQQQSNTYYLHVKTQDSLQVPLFLWSDTSFPKHNALSTGLQGIYFGIMIVMVLYNLFIYLSVRDQSYLYYIGYISAFTLFQASMQGYSFEYFWPNNTWWANTNIPFLGILSLFFAALFARNFLHTKELLPRLDNALIFIASALFITLPIIIFGSYNAGIYSAIISSFIFFNLVLLTGIIAAYNGNRTAKFFVIAWSIFLISGVISMLGMLDILPLEYGNQIAIQIGSALEVILLSMALADRINLIEKEKVEIETHSKKVLQDANKQLENSNRLKDEFIATISHEIRTPMNGILGSTQLLGDTTLNKNQTLYIDTINRSGQTLLEILNNILDYSKIEADKLTIDNSEFVLEDVINECADFFGVISAQNRVKLFVRIHKGTPKVILSDPLRLKQILLNLLSNAFKYTSRGQIVINVQLAENNKHQLLIEVEDSGNGLTYEQQNILFQPFVQVDASSTREKGGTGLGLAICKRLAQLLGGEIGVHSLPGKGATFWFSAKIEVIEQDNVASLPEMSVCILLDSSYQESLIKNQLQDWGIPTVSRHLIKYDQEVSVITNESHVKELLSLAIPASNIIIICNQSHSENKRGQRINSPITPSKIRSALRANSTASAHQEILLGKNKIGAVLPDFSKLKVLAVDDNSVNRMIIKKMLKKYNIEADIAVGGIEAIELIKHHNEQYDLILMDIEMPVKDGYLTTSEIRKYERDSEIDPSRIVAVSAHSMKESRGKALISGMDDFLSKPIDQNILIDILTIARSQSLATSE